MDWATGICTRAEGELELERGIYTFDGIAITVHSGSVISGSVAGYGDIINVRKYDYIPDDKTNFGGAFMVADYCPP